MNNRIENIIISTKPVVSVCAVRDRLRQIPDQPEGYRNPQKNGQNRRGGPSPHAVRRSGEAGGAAIRHGRGPGQAQRAPSKSAKSTSLTSAWVVVVYAGVDYEKILWEAEKEADVILWDGGNNDTPFYKPDLHIVLWIPTGRATSPPTTRARPTCRWPTSSSSTRWTAPLRKTSRSSAGTSKPTTRRPASCWPTPN